VIRASILILGIALIYLFFWKRHILKSIMGTLKINRLLRLNLMRILSRLIF